MKNRFLAASILLALTAPVLAEGGRHAARVMLHLDTNGDELISIDEFRGPSDRLLKHADANNDGMVTKQEMAAHRQSMRETRQQHAAARMAEHEARMDEMFAKMDSDGDGAVTGDEARLAIFSRMDKNGDGYLSADELRPSRGMRHDGGHRHHKRMSEHDHME